MTQALVLSITGIVDSAIVGQFWDAEGLAGMKLAMPVVSILYMIGSVLSTGLSVQVTKLLAKGKRAEANQHFIWVCTAALGDLFCAHDSGAASSGYDHRFLCRLH